MRTNRPGMYTGRAALPEGTVTVLSTDVVGSTLLNQRLGDEVATGIERELAGLVLEQVEKQRGVVIKDTGDGLMVAFQSARRAVICAQEIQRAIARRNRSRPETAVELRVGLHTGEVLKEDGGLHGETLIVAKRIEALAPAGGIFALPRPQRSHRLLGVRLGHRVARQVEVPPREPLAAGYLQPWRWRRGDALGGPTARARRRLLRGVPAHEREARDALERRPVPQRDRGCGGGLTREG